MQVLIATRHGDLSEASQAKLTAKVEKLKRIFDRLTSIEVTVDLKDPQRPNVHLNVSAEHKHDFVAHDTSENLFGSVDAVISKVEQQLRKYKEKVQQKHRDPEARRHGAANDALAGLRQVSEDEQGSDEDIDAVAEADEV